MLRGPRRARLSGQRGPRGRAVQGAPPGAANQRSTPGAHPRAHPGGLPARSGRLASVPAPCRLPGRGLRGRTPPPAGASQPKVCPLLPAAVPRAQLKQERQRTRPGLGTQQRPWGVRSPLTRPELWASQQLQGLQKGPWRSSTWTRPTRPRGRTHHRHRRPQACALPPIAPRAAP